MEIEERSGGYIGALAQSGSGMAENFSLLPLIIISAVAMSRSMQSRSKSPWFWTWTCFLLAIVMAMLQHARSDVNTGSEAKALPLW